jgi:hypothetical protein
LAEKAIMKNLKDIGGRGNSGAAAKACLSMAPHCVALLCAMSLVGCLAQTGEESDGDVGVTQEAALTHNALTHNALTHNALTHNALSSNALTGSSLTSTALANNATLTAALADADSREVLSYIASCALAPGSHLDFTVEGVPYSFPGELGLVPSWGQTGGTCDSQCQEGVSACVISRLDYLGQYVSISMRGPSPLVNASPSELAEYTTAEGAYYGNIFLATPEMYACTAPGQTGLSRVCGPTTVDCIVNVVGACSAICDKADKRQGFFPNCRNAAKDAGGHWPAGTHAYPFPASIFVAP